MMKRKMQPPDRTREKCNGSSLRLGRAHDLAKQRLLRSGFADVSGGKAEFAARIVARFFKKLGNLGSAAIQYSPIPAIRGGRRNFLSFRPIFCLLLKGVLQIDRGDKRKLAVAEKIFCGARQESPVVMGKTLQGLAQVGEIGGPRARHTIALRRYAVNKIHAASQEAAVFRFLQPSLRRTEKLVANFPEQVKSSKALKLFPFDTEPAMAILKRIRRSPRVELRGSRGEMVYEKVDGGGLGQIKAVFEGEIDTELQKPIQALPGPADLHSLPTNIGQITEHVISQLDRRMIAWRERMGKI